MAWGWNTTIKTSTSIRPFENMTGMAPVSATDSSIIDTEESVQFDTSKLRESAAEYIRIATRHGGYMRKVRALILNKRGRALKKLNKGDLKKLCPTLS